MLIYPIPGNYKKKNIDVSIIIPLYKSRSVVKDQIMRWVQDDDLEVEIIYVSDNCPDKSAVAVSEAWNRRPDKHKFNVKILPLRHNHGFGGACNNGAYYAQGKHLIFLNADTVVTPNWIKPMLRLFDDPKVGIVGNMQLKEGGPLHGTIDSAGSEWAWTTLNFLHIGRHSYHGELLDEPFAYDEAPADLLVPAEREMVTGCCFAIPKKLFDEVGGFDYHYRRAYWEDTELNLSVRDMGYKVMFQPESVIYHKLSHAEVGEHPYHHLNKTHFLNKWVKTERIDKLVRAERPIMPETITNILVRRHAANGDVLVAAAIVPALKKKYPNSTIYFETKCPQVLIYNPHIDYITEEEPQGVTFNYMVDLDLAYERRPFSNILQCYADEAGVDAKDCELSLYEARVVKPLLNGYVVIHAGRTNWAGRNWHQDRWRELALRIHDSGHQIICVGRSGDHFVPCDVDCREKTTIHELATIIKDAKLFVGIDSMPFHISQATKTPGVAFFGSIKPELRIINDNITPCTAKDLGCLGCHHRRPAPSVVTNECETGTHDCENLVTVDDMWNLIKEKLGC